MEKIAADEIIRSFRNHVDQYVTSHSCFGSRLIDEEEGQPVKFVPHDCLAVFWTAEKIRNILWSAQPPMIQVDTEAILGKYLVVFSILVWISRAGEIKTIMEDFDFDDCNLPVNDNSFNGAQQDEHKELLGMFSKAQWKFCPFTLDFESRPYRKGLNPYHILPISEKKLLDSTVDEEDADAEVLVYKARWHSSCLSSPVHPGLEVVLKEYRIINPNAEKMLNNEIDIYSQLGDSDFDHILRYYGSFSQQGKYTLILEYASRGTLLDYFEKQPRPQTIGHRIEFWRAFFSLLLGLGRIHCLCKARDLVLKGVHQDIRPQNILVFPCPDESPDQVCFKLADFGTGHVRKIRDGGLDSLAAHGKGNGMYSSPESFRDDKVVKVQTPQCDVWSLGAVASEALVWSLRGETERLEYQGRRCEETRKTKLKGGFHEGCFHDGSCRLRVVDEEHRSVLTCADGDDIISTVVSDLILDYMLIANPTDGHEADAVFEKWEWKLDEICNPGISLYSPQSSTIPALWRPPTRRSDTLKSRDTRKRFSAYSTHTHTSSFAHYRQDGVFSEEPGDVGPLHSRSPRSPDPPPLHRSPHHAYPGDLTNRSRTPNWVPGPSNHGTSEVGLPRPATVDQPGRFGSHPPRLDEDPEDDDEHRPATLNTAAMPPLHSAPHQSRTDAKPTRPRGHGPSHSSPSQPVSNDPPETEDAFHIQGSSRVVSTRNSAPVLPTVPTGTPNDQSGHPESTITIDKIYSEYIKPKDKDKSTFRGRFRKAPGILQVFPSLEKTLKDLKGYGGGRDQYFIIDDSQSMARHQDQIGKTVRVLAYLLKKGEVDPDKMEIFFACKKVRVARAESSAFQGLIDEHTFSGGPCNISEVFDDIATEILKHSNNRITIYILTNGRWNAPPRKPHALCGVDKVIQRFLNVIKKDDFKQSNHIGVQFIRFYNPNSLEDRDGRTRLQHLDDDLSQRFKNMNLGFSKGDIVDTTDWDGSVQKMLRGAVFSDMD
ncbi:hypothetical protein OQA88_5282 [Cercophora sp. LCS_1]